MEETVSSLMVIHMDSYGRIMGGLLNIYFINSVFHPMSLSLMMKSSYFHVHSSFDLFRKAFVGFISHPEL
jgi:hypothetical protein